MARRVEKSELPRKICVVCQRVFVWRKKWRKDWEMVRHCSDACRRARRGGPGGNGTLLAKSEKPV